MFSIWQRLAVITTVALVLILNISCFLELKQQEAMDWSRASILSKQARALTMKVVLYEKRLKVYQKREAEHQKRVAAIVKKYSADPAVVSAALKAAEQYQYKDFPRAKDLIALVGIESSWRHGICSKLQRDPACGLTQVRLGIWKQVIGEDDIRDVSTQIRVAADILHHYYSRLRNKRDALLAYNVGPTNLFNNQFNPFYHTKFVHELAFVDKNIKT